LKLKNQSSIDNENQVEPKRP